MENKIARLMRNTGPARFFIPVGLILIIFGIILSGFKTDNYAETKGKITSVVENTSNTDSKGYDVSFTYTVDGKEYEGSFDNLSGSFKTGDEIAVFYDPADPGRITNSKMSGIIPPVMIALGAVAVVFGILKTVQAMKKSKELDQITPGKGAPAADFEGFKRSAGITEYYSRHDGNTLKPGYIIEDAGRRALFEAKMTKNNLVGARIFEFSDHTTGSVKEHEVGHVATQTYNDEFFSAKSWFKYDGENIWEVLHGRGIRLATDLHSKFPYSMYNVSKDGAPFARIESTSMYVHEDDEAAHKVKIPVGRYYYRIWTDSTDLETIFLTVFAISETEQAVVE